jgi:hypothetical protein
MTRRRLWCLTALVCLLLSLPSLPAAWRARTVAGLETSARAAASALTAAAGRLPPPDPHAAQIALAAASMLLGLGLLVRRQRRPAAEVATRLARRGRPVAAIARHTGLAQDAVRDLLGGEPMVVSTADQGRFFRRVRRAPRAPAGAFADELRERSFDARA